MDTVDGKVTYVSSRPYTTSSGGQLYSVDIEVENPGSLQEGMKASAEIETSAGTVSSVDAGSLQYKTKSAIKSAGGTITQVNIRQNQYVKKGELLVSLENKDITKTVEETDQKIKDFEKQLESVQEQLDNYKICSPIEGVIVSQTVNVGDIVKAGDALSVVSDDKSMEFTIPVDELDIQKVKMGQEANITVDALHDTTLKPLAGKVTHIALEGTSTNGVTTYPVTVSVSQYDGLLAGMNANAEIFITRKTDVLYVPIEAIQRVAGKTYVMVKGDPQKITEMKKDGTYIDLFGDTARSYSSGGSTGQSGGTGQNRNNNNRNTGNANRNSTGEGNNDSSGARAISNVLSKYKDYYADAIPTPVEVGLNNETSIEIVSGLKEGDEIILPPMASSNSSAQGFRLPGGMNFGSAGGSTNSSTRRQQN
jgi:HlyD family secretion protein